MSKRILVIDDDHAVRKSFALAFEDTDYQVDAVESGERGIEKVKEAKYDLIFLDLRMPGMNGFETLRELRKMDQHLPVYIITAFQEEFLRELKAAVEEGLMFQLLCKPVGKDEVLAVTKGVLEGVAQY